MAARRSGAKYGETIAVPASLLHPMNLLRYRSSLSALFILGCSAMALSSCAFLIFVKSPRRVPFDEAALAGNRGPGTGTVTGQLVATDEGVAHPGEGVPITLIPVTAYTREMVDRILGDGENLTASDPRFRKYVRKTDADHQGNFCFHPSPRGRVSSCRAKPLGTDLDLPIPTTLSGPANASRWAKAKPCGSKSRTIPSTATAR